MGLIGGLRSGFVAPPVERLAPAPGTAVRGTPVRLIAAPGPRPPRTGSAAAVRAAGGTNSVPVQ